MSLEVRVLNPLTHIHALVDDVGFGEAFLDITDVAVQLSDDVALRIGNAR